MVSQLKVNEIIKQSGSSVSIGESGDTINLAGTAYAVANNKPLVSVYASADTAMSDNAFVKVPFNTETFDTGSDFDSTTNYRFVAPSTDYYLITTQVGVQSNSDDGLYSQQSYIAKNGAEYIQKAQNFGNARIRHHYDSITVIAYLTASDYIEVFTRADWASASSSNIYGGSKNTYINITKLLG
jgi:hypothetical protein